MPSWRWASSLRAPLSWALLLAILVLGPGCAAKNGSEDEREVLGTVQEFFDVMESKDVQRASQIVIPEGVFVNLRSADGRRSLKHFSNASWLADMPGEARSLRESFVGDPLVLVDGDIAVVWTAYTFDVDGQHSHTGTDIFNLLRTDEGWKISGGAYTVVQ